MNKGSSQTTGYGSPVRKGGEDVTYTSLLGCSPNRRVCACSPHVRDDATRPDPETIAHLAKQAARWGPGWAREDMRGAAVTAMYEHLERHDDPDAARLASVAHDAARSTLRQARFLAGPWQSRVAAQLSVPPSRGLQPNGDNMPLHDALASGAGEVNLDGVVDRLCVILAERGVSPSAVEDAIEVLANATSSRPSTTHSRVFDVSPGIMAAASGLSVASCSALKSLVIGSRQRPDRGSPGAMGLLARAACGLDIWNDERTMALIDKIVEGAALSAARGDRGKA